MSGAELSDAGRVSDFGLQLDQLEGLCTEDYLLTNLTDPLQDSQVNQDSLSQQSNDFSPSKLEKPDSRKILSNRRAQQRFRVRQKAKKVEERTELQRLKQQVKDLEAQLNSANPGRDSSSLTQDVLLPPRSSMHDTSSESLLETVGALRLERTILQAKEHKIEVLLRELHTPQQQSSPLASFGTLFKVGSLKGHSHYARDLRRARNLQDLTIHPDWTADSPVDWKPFFEALQTGQDNCNIAFKTGPLKNHCIPARNLLTLPLQCIIDMIMQYKDFCHEHLSKSVQQQEQQYSEANFEVNARLLKEYVAIGMVGIELSVLEPFTPSSESGTVMRANMAWLPKWGEVLDAALLTRAQEHQLADVAHQYAAAMQELQHHARSLCKQLQDALITNSTASHMATHVFSTTEALTDCLEEQHECGLQVVRQVCLQVLSSVQMGRMCAASWPHMLDFPALVHIVASRLDKGHIGEQADLSGAPQGIPDLLSKWLNKQAKVDVSPSEGPHQMSPDFGEPLNTSLLQGMY